MFKTLHVMKLLAKKRDRLLSPSERTRK